MNDIREQFVRHLERDLRDWEDAANFCEQHIISTQFSGASPRSGQQEAEKYRARITEIRELLDKVAQEQ